MHAPFSHETPRFRVPVGADESNVYHQCLPMLFDGARRARQQLMLARRSNTWPVTIELGERAMLFTRSLMEERADAAEEQRPSQLAQEGEESQARPFVDILRTESSRILAIMKE